MSIDIGTLINYLVSGLFALALVIFVGWKSSRREKGPKKKKDSNNLDE